MKKVILMATILSGINVCYGNEPMIIIHDNLNQITAPKVTELKIDRDISRVETLKFDSVNPTIVAAEKKKIASKPKYYKEPKVTKSTVRVEAMEQPKLTKKELVVPMPLTSVPRKDWAVVNGKKVLITNLAAAPKPLVINQIEQKVNLKTSKIEHSANNGSMEPATSIWSSFMAFIKNWIYIGVMIMVSLLATMLVWIKFSKNEEDINYF